MPDAATARDVVDGMKVRDFRAGDQDKVKTLVLAGLEEHWGALDETLNADLEDIAASYSGGRTLVVEVDGSVIGTGTVVLRQEGVAEIVRMSVRRDFRRKGVGRLITSELLKVVSEWGVMRVVLETSAHWEDVVAFYSSCGFSITGYEEGDFGRDAWFEHLLGDSERGKSSAVPPCS
jgi:GNAT superfamily N-acetyltransferase